MKRSRILIFSFLFILVACKKTTEENPVLPFLEEVKMDYAPDKRVALFAIEALKENGTYVLKGESDLPEAIAALKQKLTDNDIPFTDSIQPLPSKELEDKIWGLITISVANLRSQPKHSAELATQAILGTPVKILKREGDWYYIQTPDKYLAWVDQGGISPCTEQHIKNWETSRKIIFTKTYGHSYSGPEEKEIVSDLVAGSILTVLKDVDDFYIVDYPDGRKAYVAKTEAADYKAWLDNLEPDTNKLVETSKRFMGIPYLWGGTSTKGADCSGFTKTIYFLNGLIIPRDASQQVRTGKAIDSLGDFASLERGDLLFFGRKATDSTAEKVVHVGMWIGNQKFIHASEMVRISSMDENDKLYDAFNKNRYLRTKRILNQKDEALIDLKAKTDF